VHTGLRLILDAAPAAVPEADVRNTATAAATAEWQQAEGAWHASSEPPDAIHMLIRPVASAAICTVLGVPPYRRT